MIYMQIVSLFIVAGVGQSVERVALNLKVAGLSLDFGSTISVHVCRSIIFAFIG